MALLGNGPELVVTPGMAPVALPRMLHHLTTAGERGGEGGKKGQRGGEDDKCYLRGRALSHLHTGIGTINNPQPEQMQRLLRLSLLLTMQAFSTADELLWDHTSAQYAPCTNATFMCRCCLIQSNLLLMLHANQSYVCFQSQMKKVDFATTMNLKQEANVKKCI